ncbi:hypothetical protein Sjap_003769 [Stephania japonica]|uniref:Uncharacterized protein n=1 Tax=Stephania japonica TaxID=461633 RepID=A0AAP0KR61_9MAGN
MMGVLTRMMPSRQPIPWWHTGPHLLKPRRPGNPVAGDILKMLWNKYVDGNKDDGTPDEDRLCYPYNYLNIIKESDSNASPDDQLNHIATGIYLDHKKKMYWVDEKTGCNCFLLFARSLSITWGNDSRYWNWPYMEDTKSNTMIEMAELRSVFWLEIRGKLNGSYLSPQTNYEVVFIVKLNREAYGWDRPVTLKLVQPNGKVQQQQVTLENKKREQYIEICVGEFNSGHDEKGELEFALLGNESYIGKSGLTIRGVIIRPKQY